MRTLEECSHCPICKKPGEAGAVFDLKDPISGKPTGKKSHTFSCRNPLCRWYTTGVDGWQVQVNPDGSIPMLEPGENNPLELPPIPKITDDVLKQLDEIDPTGEMRRNIGL